MIKILWFLFFAFTGKQINFKQNYLKTNKKLKRKLEIFLNELNLDSIPEHQNVHNIGLSSKYLTNGS